MSIPKPLASTLTLTSASASRRDSKSSIFSSRLNREIPLLTGYGTLPPFLNLTSHTWDNNQQVQQQQISCTLTFSVTTTTVASRTAVVSLQTTLTSTSYPFTPPQFTLLPNPHLIPTPSPHTPIPLSLMWAPSLTVLDCVLDVAVRVKECIRNDDTFENLLAMVPTESESQNEPLQTQQTVTVDDKDKDKKKPAEVSESLCK